MATSTKQTNPSAGPGVDSTDEPSISAGESSEAGSFTSDDRAQTNLVGLFIGLMIAGIVCLQVFIPVINDAIASSDLTGTEQTIAELLPMFGALLLLVALASPLMRRL